MRRLNRNVVVCSLLVLACHIGAKAQEEACTRVLPEFSQSVQLPGLLIESILRDDVDGDGQSDLLLFVSLGVSPFDPGPRAVHVVTPWADGTLQSKELFRTAQISRFGQTQVKTGDLNGDGRADFILKRRTTFSAPETLLTFVSQQDGSYSRPSTIELPQVAGFSIGDFDGDRRDELVVTSRSLGARIALYDLESGEWLARTIAVLFQESLLSAADLDGDGDDELIGTSFGVFSWRWLEGDPTLPLQSVRTQFGPQPINASRIEPIELDSTNPGLEVVFSSADTSDRPYEARLYAFSYDGVAKRFQQLWRQDLEPAGRFIDIVDIDGDRRRDIVVSSPFQREISSSSEKLPNPPRPDSGFVVYSNRGTNPPELILQSESALRLVMVRDLDGDSRPEAITWARGSGSYLMNGLVVLQDEGVGFSEPDRYGSGPTIRTDAVARDDFDGDGIEDVMTFEPQGSGRGTFSIELSDGAGGYSVSDRVSTSGRPQFRQRFYGDFDLNGRIDVAYDIADDVPRARRAMFVSYVESDATFQPFQTQAIPGTFWFTQMGQFNDDGSPDFLGLVADDYWVVLTGSRQWNAMPPFQPFEGCLRLFDLRVIDATGDGLSDLVLPCRPEQGEGPFTLRVWRAVGDGRFAPPEELLEWDPQVETLATPLSGDLDGDGQNELVLQWARDGNARVAVYSYDVEAGLEELWSGELPAVANRLRDLDHDGRLDLLRSDRGLIFWAGDGAGGFFTDLAQAWYADGSFAEDDLNEDEFIDFFGSFQTRVSDPKSVFDPMQPVTLAADSEAPRVDLLLDPILEESGAVTIIDSWRVRVRSYDTCDAAPLQELALEVLTDLGSAPASFRTSTSEEIRVYRAGSGDNVVVLAGPSEDAIRTRLDMAATSGAIALPDTIHLDLVSRDGLDVQPGQFGDEDHVGSAARLRERYVFEPGGELRAAYTYGADADIVIRGVATDASGRQTTERVSFRETASEACASRQIPGCGVSH